MFSDFKKNNKDYWTTSYFLSIFLMFNVVEHSQNKLVPVILYTVTDKNSYSLIITSLSLFLCLEGNKKKKWLVIKKKSEKAWEWERKWCPWSKPAPWWRRYFIKYCLRDTLTSCDTRHHNHFSSSHGWIIQYEHCLRQKYSGIFWEFSTLEREPDDATMRHCIIIMRC